MQVRDAASPWVDIAMVLSPGSSAPRKVQTSMVDSCWSATSPGSLIEVACSSSDADYRVSNIVSEPIQCEAAYIDASSGYACLKRW